MIIWINGAFGAGKTQTAYELHKRLPGTFVYDPENAGFFLQKNTPKEIAKPDFQQYPLWREINYSVLKQYSQEYEGTIIVPMTIVDEKIFGEIVGRLREDGVVVHHYTLWASPDTLLKRLKKKGDKEGSWPAQQIDRCLTGLGDDIFKKHIHTDNKTIDEVVDVISTNLGLNLEPDNRGNLRRKTDRIKVQIKQLSLFN